MSGTSVGSATGGHASAQAAQNYAVTPPQQHQKQQPPQANAVATNTQAPTAVSPSTNTHGQTVGQLVNTKA